MFRVGEVNTLALTLALSHDGRGDWIPAFAGMTVAVCVVSSHEI